MPRSDWDRISVRVEWSGAGVRNSTLVWPLGAAVVLGIFLCISLKKANVLMVQHLVTLMFLQALCILYAGAFLHHQTDNSNRSCRRMFPRLSI